MKSSGKAALCGLQFRQRPAGMGIKNAWKGVPLPFQAWVAAGAFGLTFPFRWAVCRRRTIRQGGGVFCHAEDGDDHFQADAGHQDGEGEDNWGEDKRYGINGSRFRFEAHEDDGKRYEGRTDDAQDVEDGDDARGHGLGEGDVQQTLDDSLLFRGTASVRG